MKSTRLSIVEQALEDVLQRLSELPKSASARAFRARAESYARAARGWAVRSPTEEQRATMMKLVIELSLEVMAEGRGGSDGSGGEQSVPGNAGEGDDGGSPVTTHKTKRLKG